MTSRATMARAVREDLGLRECPRRWVPHDLTEAQRMECVWLSGGPLESLRLHDDAESKGLATANESWAARVGL
jgi:hypothetical protein